MLCSRERAFSSSETHVCTSFRTCWSGQIETPFPWVELVYSQCQLSIKYIQHHVDGRNGMIRGANVSAHQTLLICTTTIPFVSLSFPLLSIPPQMKYIYTCTLTVLYCTILFKVSLNPGFLSIICYSLILPLTLPLTLIHFTSRLRP